MKNFNLIEWLQTDSHGKQSATRDHHGTKSRELAGNPRPLRYPCATLALPLRYVAMITLLLTLACGNVWGANGDVLFTQNFNSATAVDYAVSTARSYNSSSTLSGLVGTGTNLFTSIKCTSKGKCGIGINSATGGNGVSYSGKFGTYNNNTGYQWSICKTSNFAATAPTAVKITFDALLAVVDNGTSKQAVTFLVGSGFSDGITSSLPSASNIYTGFTFYTGSSSSKKHAICKVGSTTLLSSSEVIDYNTMKSFTWVINNTGNSLTYTAPTGSSETVATGTWDLWMGTTKILNDQAKNTGSSTFSGTTIQNLYMGSSTGVKHEFHLDNVVVTDLTPSSGFTVSATANPAGYGSVSPTSLTGIASGTAVSTSSNVLTVGASSITATAASATSAWTYSFTNWTKSDGTALPSTVTAALAVRANFSRTGKSYTITLDKDGGSGGLPTVSATYGSAMPSAGAAPTKSGFAFLGYWTSKVGAGTQYYNATPASVKNSDFTSTATLYAGWKVNAPSISFSEDLSNMVTITGTAGASIYYTTDGSTPSESSTLYSAPFTINADKTIKAIAIKAGAQNSAVASLSCTYSAPPTWYTLSYDANGGSGSMPAQEFVSGTTVYAAQNAGFTAPTGKIFSGWNTKSDGEGTSYAEGASFTLSGNTTLYAQWITASTSSTYCINMYNLNVSDQMKYFTYSGSNDMQILDLEVPDYKTNTNNFWVGNGGVWKSGELGNSGASSANEKLEDMCLKGNRGTKLGTGSQGVLARFFIYDNSTYNNLYIEFTPKQYSLIWGPDGSSWSPVKLYPSGYENEWTSEVVTLTSDQISSYNYYVGILKADNGVAFWYKSKTLTVGSMGTYNKRTDKWGGNVSTLSAGDKGFFRMWQDATDYDNWRCHFVPVYTLSYNANSGSGAPSAVYIASEGDDAHRTVYVSATEPTRTGYTFTGWATTSGRAAAGTVDYVAGTAITIDEDTELFAVWTCITPDAPTAAKITVTPSCAGTGATFSANTAGIPSYVTWYWETAADGTSTSYPASSDYTTSTTAGTYTMYLRAKNTACGEWSNSASTPSKSVKVKTPVTASWSTSPANGTAGGNMNATLTTNYASGVVYSSSNTDVATVSGNGTTTCTITYASAGSARITATVTGAGDSYCSTASVYTDITVADPKYTVTYTANGGSGSVPTDNNAYDPDDEVTVLGKNSLSKSGYTFMGWTDGNSHFYVEGDKFNITGNTTLTAVWDGGSTAFYHGSITITTGALTPGSTGSHKGFFTNTSGTIATSSAISLTSTPGEGGYYYESTTVSDAALSNSSNWNASSTSNRTIRSFKYKSGDTYTLALGSYVATSIKFYGYNGSASKTMTVGGVSWTCSSTKEVFDTHNFTKSGNFTGNVTITQDGDFYGVLVVTCNTYTGKKVSFNKGSGPSTVSGLPGDRYVPSGSKISRPATNPTATGYIFNGWVTTSGGSTSFDFANTTITTDKTIYAKWTAKTAPTQYTFSLSDPCASATPSATLSGSQSGWSYQLYKNGAVSGDPKAGTGNALTWTGLTAGSYYVKTVETSTQASAQIGSSATVYAGTTITSNLSSSRSVNANVSTTVSITATGASLTYQWYTCNSDGTGKVAVDGKTTNSFAYTFTNEDAPTKYICCVVTGTCGTVTSNIQTVTITPTYLLTYDANGGNGAPAAAYRAATTAALSGTIPTLSSHRFLGWNTESDGSGTRYAASASFPMPAQATTLWAEWQEEASLQWVPNLNTEESSIGTNSKSSSYTTRIPISAMSAISNYGSLTITSSKKENLTSKIATPASYDAGKYMYVTFTVPANYEFVLNSASVKVQPVGENEHKAVKLELTDASGHSISNTPVKCNGTSGGSTATVTLSNDGGIAFVGTVTLKIYVYAHADASASSYNCYRMGSPIAISGDINYICPERPTITKPTSAQTMKVYTDENRMLSVEVDTYNSGELSYQWKKDGANIAGANSATYTVVGSTLTVGTTYVYTCDVTEEGACATVSSPAFTIKIASTDCNYTEFSSAVLTSKSAADRVNATLLVNGLADMSSGSCKLNGAGAYFGLQLASGSFEVGDSIEFKIKKNDGTEAYIFATTDTTGLQTTDAIYTATSLTSGDNIIKFIVTSGTMLTKLNTTKKIAIVRRTKNGVLNQNHSVYYAKVKRYGCPDKFIFDDAAGTHEWSDDDNWIGPAGHGSGLPTNEDRVFINESVTVDVATASAAELHITNGSMVTVQKAITVGDVIIESGSTLNVAKDGEDGITVATNSLNLKGGWNDSYEYDMPRVYIDPLSTLTKVVNTVNLDISVDTRNFYPIAVPFRVRVKDVDYANSFLAGYSNYGLTGQYVIKEYDGALRAKNGPDRVNNWKVVPLEDDEGNDVYLEPGKGYILTAVSLPAYGGGVIRFPLSFTDAWTTEGEQGTVSAVTKNVVAVTAHTGKATEGDKYANKGWNLLGVPFMSCYGTSAGMYNEDNVDDPASIIQGKFNFEDGTWDGEDKVRYVNVPVHDFSEYIQTDITDAGSVLRPGWCFFVQIETSGNLKFLTADQAASSSLPIYAPKRTAEMPTEKTGIVLSGNGASDKTTLLISDKYNGAEYEINADLEKMFGNGYTLATYSLSNDTRLAYNAMSRSDAQLAIPIGYRAPAEGSYTFSINPRYVESGAFSRVDLIDYEAGTLTNLLMSDYTFTTERTQNDTRFAINVVLAPQVTTDIESVNGEGLEVNGVRKVLINNELYIVVDGKMFDATGKTVKGGQK